MRSLGLSSSARADRQHLLLPAGELAPAAQLALGQARKQLVDPRDRPRAGTLERDFQIFLDTEIGEDSSPLRNIADAARRDPDTWASG